MQIVKMSEVPKKAHLSPLFTSEDVTAQAIFPDSKDFKISIVNFGKGTRNKFHTHDTEQVLIVTDGVGIVATEKKERRVTVGDIIIIPANEKHWHGATKDSAFSHLYFTKTGSKMTQLEK